MATDKWPEARRDRLYFLKESLRLAEKAVIDAPTVAYVPPFRLWVRLLVARYISSPKTNMFDITDAIEGADPATRTLMTTEQVGDPTVLNRLFRHYIRLYDEHNLWLNQARLPRRCKALDAPNRQCPQETMAGKRYCGEHLRQAQAGYSFTKPAGNVVVKSYFDRDR